MGRRLQLLGLALVTGAALMAGLLPQLHAATSSTQDILSNDRDALDSVDVGVVKPVARPNPAPARAAPVSGNPLWSVPLSLLSATQERPIFSASRRPPQRAVVAQPVEQEIAPPPKTEQDQPPLTLVGAVVGESDAIAIFVDRTSQKMIRLRPGEAHAGWVLGSVLRREVTLKKNDRTDVLTLPRPDEPAASPPVAPTLPVAIGSGVPFLPRSTPRNGAADGL